MQEMCSPLESLNRAGVCWSDLMSRRGAVSHLHHHNASQGQQFKMSRSFFWNSWISYFLKHLQAAPEHLMWPHVVGKGSQPTAQAGKDGAGGFIPWNKTTCTAAYSVCFTVCTYTSEKRSFTLTPSRERKSGNGGCDEINGYYEI